MRVLMCQHCGAPFEVPVEGGTFECSSCDAELVVERRTIKEVRVIDPTLEPGLPEREVERRRRKSLRQQQADYNEDNPYSFYNAPDGYDFLGGTNELDPSVPAMANQAFVAALEACRRGGGSLPQQRAVFWVARKLKNIWTQRNEPQRARAAIETALETVRDPGFVHMLRTAMADLARVEGDYALARVWLDRCDPAPWMLDLDTSYRTSLAILHAEQGEWREALELIGEERDEVPYEPSSVAVMSSLRVAALENLGLGPKAEAELRWLIEDSVVPVDFLDTMYEGSTNYEACRTVWARLRVADEPLVLDADDELLIERPAAFSDLFDEMPSMTSAEPEPEPNSTTIGSSMLLWVLIVTLMLVGGVAGYMLMIAS